MALSCRWGGWVSRILHHPLYDEEIVCQGKKGCFEGGLIMLCSLDWWRWDCVWFGARAGS